MLEAIFAAMLLFVVVTQVRRAAVARQNASRILRSWEKQQARFGTCAHVTKPASGLALSIQEMRDLLDKAVKAGYGEKLFEVAVADAPNCLAGIPVVHIGGAADGDLRMQAHPFFVPTTAVFAFCDEAKPSLSRLVERFSRGAY